MNPANTPKVKRVTREDMLVRYIEVLDDITQIRAAWPQLEAAVGSLRGRKFLAAFDPVQGWYRTCVLTQDEATPQELAFPEFLVPGGDFLRVRLRGHPPEVYDEIGPTYSRLEATADRDDSRPSIESYRRLDVIDVLMPVKPLDSGNDRLT